MQMVEPSSAMPIFCPLTTIIQCNIYYITPVHLIESQKEKGKKKDPKFKRGQYPPIIYAWCYTILLGVEGHKHQIPKTHDEVYPFGYSDTKMWLDLRD